MAKNASQAASRLPQRRAGRAPFRPPFRSAAAGALLPTAGSGSQIPPRRRCRHSHGDTAGPRGCLCEGLNRYRNRDCRRRLACLFARSPGGRQPRRLPPARVLPAREQKSAPPRPQLGPARREAAARPLPRLPRRMRSRTGACVLSVPLRGAFVAAGAGGAGVRGRLRSRRGSGPVPSRPVPVPTSRGRQRKSDGGSLAGRPRRGPARPGGCGPPRPVPSAAGARLASGRGGSRAGPGRPRTPLLLLLLLSAMATELEPPAAGAVSGGAPLEAEEDEEHWLYGGTGRRGLGVGPGDGLGERGRGAAVCRGWGRGPASPVLVRLRPSRDSLSPRRPLTSPGRTAPQMCWSRTEPRGCRRLPT